MSLSDFCKIVTCDLIVFVHACVNEARKMVTDYQPLTTLKIKPFLLLNVLKPKKIFHVSIGLFLILNFLLNKEVYNIPFVRPRKC